MNDSLFRTLNPEETLDFQAYAYENWTPNTLAESIWHPEVQIAWGLMNSLANAVPNVYEKCALDINAMPSNVNADMAAEAVADAFTAHASPEECAVWHNIPVAARNRVVRQIVGGYY